jgi:threonine 3-dehydrogenase
MEQKTMFGVIKEKPAPGAVYRTDLPVPEIGPDDILVKIKVAAICGTDQHILPWTDYAAARVPTPMVFGHEFSGDIVEAGKNVKELKIGDRVAGETHIPCNHCHQCKTNNRHICENMKIIGVQVPGAFAEYIAFPKDCAYRIADSVSYEVGAMLEPMGVGVHGVTSALVKGQNVVIFGCGPIGLMAVGAARAHGAEKIIAVDVFDEKLAVALKMGADLIFNSKRDDIPAKAAELFGGIGADIVIDYTGNQSAIQSGFSTLRKGGRFVMVGLLGGDITFNFNDNIIYKEATVIGVTGRLMYETWEECEKILATPGFDITPCIGGTYPLKDFEDAFEAIKSGKPGKMLLVP